ncbi:hypothetical protein Tco_0163024 [Tanacetum coccineum]
MNGLHCIPKIRASGIKSIRRIGSSQYGVLGFSWSGNHDKYLPESFMNHQWIQRISLHGYGVLVFISSWLLVKFRRRYVVSSLMDTAIKFISESLRKSDKVYQRIEANSLAINHKLDEMIESLESLPKETNEKDLAKHEINFISDSLRKSDKVYQRIEANSLAINHKLDEMIESLESLPKETNDKDLAKHE